MGHKRVPIGSIIWRFCLIARGLTLFALPRSTGHQCQAGDEIHGKVQSVFEGFTFVCFLKGGEKQKPPLCAFVE